MATREKRPGAWELQVRTGWDPLTGGPDRYAGRCAGKRQTEADLARLSAEVAEWRHPATGQGVSHLLDAWVAQLEASDRQAAEITGRIGSRPAPASEE